MKSKKGFQLSTNMLVVIILGLVILGAGVSIFFSAFNEVTELRSDVDEQTASRINSLLDDGSLIVIPFSSKDGKRGNYVDFDMGINNELGNTYKFSVLVTYAGSTAYPTAQHGDLPLYPVDLSMIQNIGEGVEAICPDFYNRDGSGCASAWVMKFDINNIFVKKDFEILNDNKALVPIRIVIPKKNVPKGQYIFNVDVCYNVSDSRSECFVVDDKIGNRFASREKLYITI